MTPVTARSPRWVAKKKQKSPALPRIPVSTLIQRASVGGSLNSPMATAVQAIVATAASSATARGQKSVRDPARLRAVRDNPNPTPATRPQITPAMGRPARPGPLSVSTGPATSMPGPRPMDTIVIAGSVSAMPARESSPGRSPNNRPAITDSVAAATALTELATLNAAWRRPVYSAISPIPPPIPATTPHAREDPDGVWRLTNGTMDMTRTALTTSAVTVTLTTKPTRRPATPAT